LNRDNERNEDGPEIDVTL